MRKEERGEGGGREGGREPCFTYTDTRDTPFCPVSSAPPRVVPSDSYHCA